MIISMKFSFWGGCLFVFELCLGGFSQTRGQSTHYISISSFDMSALKNEMFHKTVSVI